MQKLLLRIFGVLSVVILAAKISSWFADYGESTDTWINNVMFSVIGAYIMTTGFYLQKILYKAIFVLCGAFLFMYSFMPENSFLPFIGIACMVVPFVIGRFFLGRNDEKTLFR